MTFNNQPDWKKCEEEDVSFKKCEEGCGTVLTANIPIMCWVSKDKEEKTVCRTCYDDCDYKETDTNSDNEEEEEECDFNVYGCKKMYKIVITVAGGGMGNGNAYATVEGEWDSEEDFNDDNDGEIYYCEYGNNPVKDYRGSQLKFNEEGTSFNIV